MFEQERFIGRLQRHVLAEADIQACFLTGSFGRRLEDLYSDVDAVLVYEDAGAREAAWAARREFVRFVMPYVAVRSFDAAHVRPYLHIALYSNGTKVDYLFQSKDEAQPTAHEREIRILKDKGGWAEQYQSLAARQPMQVAYLGGEELKALDDRFWVMYWDVLRQLKRGDADKPFAIYLQLLDFTLPPLLAVLPAEDPARQGLVRANFSRDTGATVRGMVELLDAYVAARAAVIRRSNLIFATNTAFESEIRRLVERLNR